MIRRTQSKPAFRVGQAAASRYRHMLANYSSINSEQENLFAFIVADVIRSERVRMRRKYTSRKRNLP